MSGLLQCILIVALADIGVIITYNCARIITKPAIVIKGSAAAGVVIFDAPRPYSVALMIIRYINIKKFTTVAIH